MRKASAETQMRVGIELRTRIMDVSGAFTDLVKTDGVLWQYGANIGGISYEAHLVTKVIGESVTDCHGRHEWEEVLLLESRPGANSDEQKTRLTVVQAGRRAVFRTVGRISQLISDDGPGDGVYYESKTFELFAMTS